LFVIGLNRVIVATPRLVLPTPGQHGLGHASPTGLRLPYCILNTTH
jgi:hypothetical protein